MVHSYRNSEAYRAADPFSRALQHNTYEADLARALADELITLETEAADEAPTEELRQTAAPARPADAPASADDLTPRGDADPNDVSAAGPSSDGCAAGEDDAAAQSQAAQKAHAAPAPFLAAAAGASADPTDAAPADQPDDVPSRVILNTAAMTGDDLPDDDKAEDGDEAALADPDALSDQGAPDAISAEAAVRPADAPDTRVAGQDPAEAPADEAAQLAAAKADPVRPAADAGDDELDAISASFARPRGAAVRKATAAPAPHRAAPAPATLAPAASTASALALQGSADDGPSGRDASAAAPVRRRELVLADGSGVMVEEDEDETEAAPACAETVTLPALQVRVEPTVRSLTPAPERTGEATGEVMARGTVGSQPVPFHTPAFVSRELIVAGPDMGQAGLFPALPAVGAWSGTFGGDGTAQDERRGPERPQARIGGTGGNGRSGGDEEPDRGPAPFRSERPLLLRDVRRIWMSAPAKKAPHTICVISLRLPKGSPHASESLTALRRTQQALIEALGGLGSVYQVAPYAIAVVFRDRALHQTTRIAEAVKSTVVQQSAEQPETPLLLAAGVAALHRDDDPTSAVCIAEHCVSLAEQASESKVLSEVSPEARFRSKQAY
ncbi:hypothetical protein [Acuticoccus yangtzensis]|uniref:hypothetical protein n=1 Tax=Acuticoccus yangtzensis TaxID=1443441 RepID=UPI000949A224|nr:hypothetical protein [Acuticoccus yangtzensis]